MSWRAVEWIAEHSESKGAARMVMLLIAHRARDEDGRAWPGLAELTKRSGYSRRHVKRAIEELIDLGELARHLPVRGEHARVIYTITGLAGCFAITTRQGTSATLQGTPAPLSGDARAHIESKRKQSKKGGDFVQRPLMLPVEDPVASQEAIDEIMSEWRASRGVHDAEHGDTATGA